MRRRWPWACGQPRRWLRSLSAKEISHFRLVDHNGVQLSSAQDTGSWNGDNLGLPLACQLVYFAERRVSGLLVGYARGLYDDDEWRKRITAQLREGHAVILIDNVTRPLDSGVLAAALTATMWTDRLLGKNETVRVPVRCVWLVTANNPVVSTELARRFVRIRLDPKVDRPWQREGFRHADLRGWAVAHRGDLVAAALTLSS